MGDTLVPRRRDYAAEGRRYRPPSCWVKDHPLGTKVSLLEGAEAGKEEAAALAAEAEASAKALDPLRELALGAAGEAEAAAANDAAVPIAQRAGEPEEKMHKDGAAGGGAESGFMPWKSKKAGILTKFTTTEAEPVKCSFIAGDEAPAAPKPVDRTQQRLAQLDEAALAQEQTKMMTQKQYVEHLEMQRNELCAAWAANERRRSLIIVIQSAKLLGGATISRFYPSKFVLITEVLDQFGSFVFQRLRHVGFMDNKRAINKFGPGRDDFSAANSVARNLARNWYFKISSIRELLPRLYVEMAYLQSYQFFESHETMEERLMRLSRMIRGVGNPLIATFCRAYLARKALEVHPQNHLYLLQCMFDFFFTFKDVRKRQTESSKLKMSWDNYFELYSPALDWLFQCLGAVATKDNFLKVLTKYEESCNSPQVLDHIIQNFPPAFICGEAIRIARYIRDSDSSSTLVPKHRLWALLCSNLLLGPPPSSQNVLPILNAVWRSVAKFEDAAAYMLVAEIMVDYPLRFCGPTEVQVFVSDVLRHVMVDRAYEQLQARIQSFVSKIVSHSQKHGGMRAIVAMDAFQNLMDVFVGNYRLDVFMDVVNAFVSNAEERATDAVVVHWLFTLCKTLHDSVNALSMQERVREIARVISLFVLRVEYGRDVEAELNFLVLCRQSFTNLDEVNRTLVLRVAGLAMRTLKLANGVHTSTRTSNFVAACLAYCYITIPSIDAVFPRLHLNLLCAEVSLQNGLLSQADHFVKAIIELLPDVPQKLVVSPVDTPATGAHVGKGEEKSTEPMLLDFLNGVLSSLLIVPGHPDFGGLYLLMGLLNALHDYEWTPGSDAKCRIFLNTISLLFALAQPKYLYHVANVESNDVLYAGDKEFRASLEEVLKKLTESLLAELAVIGKTQPDVQAARALDFFNLLAQAANLESKSFSANLAFNLFNLAVRTKAGGAYAERTLQALRDKIRLADELELRDLRSLVSRLES